MLFFTVNYSLSTQSSKPNYSLLWELSGGDLIGKSYVFGSAHINDEEAFDFPFSLLRALEECDAFAAELEIDSMNMAMLDLILDQLSDVGEGQSTAESLYDDPDGKQTFLDAYLYRVAKVLGKKTYGLELVEDQMELFSLFSDEEEMWELSEEEYQDFVDIYASGDIDMMYENYQDDIPEDLKMISRNHIQAASIIRLGKSQPTFSVVGAAHLFGDQNVLDLLREEGYDIQRVAYDKAGSAEIEKIYSQSISEDWSQVMGFSGGYTFLSPHDFRSVFLENTIDANMDVQLDLGLIYLTMATRLSGPRGAFFQKTLLDTYIEDSEKVILFDSIETALGTNYDLLYEGDLVMRCKMTQLKDMVIAQIVMGFSYSSLDHPYVDKYLQGFQLLETSNQWSMQNSEEGFFNYYFDNNVPWQENVVDYPGFEERGKVKISYKAAYDEDGKNSYLVRYHHHLPGVVYTDEFSDLDIVVETFASAFEADIISKELISQDGYNGMDVILESDRGDVYVRAIIRGVYLYALVQSSADKSKNEEFFSAFSFNDFEEPHLSLLVDTTDNFTLLFPSYRYIYKSEEGDNEVMNYECTDIGNGSSATLELTRFDRYEEHLFHDSLVTLENLGLENKIDSLVSFEASLQDEDFPGWRLTYLSDSTRNMTSEIELFFNNLSFYFLFITPSEVDHHQYVDRIISSLNVESKQDLLNSFTSRKYDLIMSDLVSKDSVTHAKALDAYAAYDNFEEGDISQLLSFLESDFVDDSDPYNTKYYTVSNLHEFESEEIQNAIATLYHRTDNESVKTIILESLSYRSLDSSLPMFFDLLENTEPLSSYESDFYDSFSDSLAFYQENFERLLDLAEEGIADNAFFQLSVGWLEQDSTLSIKEENLSWYEAYLDNKVEEYKGEIISDSIFYPDDNVLDYYLLQHDAPSRQELYSLIMSDGSDNGKYRVFFNQISNDANVDTDEMYSLFERDMYYLYWIAELLQEKGKMNLLSEVYNSESSISEAVMTRYTYDNYSVEMKGCEVIERVNFENEIEGVENMLFLECSTRDKGNYYGLVGSFTAGGVFDFDNEKSIYYNSAKDVDDPLTLLPALIDYLKGDN